MTTTHSSIKKVFDSFDLRKKIFHFKFLPLKKKVQENYSLVMQEFKKHIKSYIDFFNEWEKTPSWIDETDEEPWYDFIDIVNNIYGCNCPYHNEDTAYGWLFQGMRRPYGQGLPTVSTNTTCTSW